MPKYGYKPKKLGRRRQASKRRAAKEAEEQTKPAYESKKAIDTAIKAEEQKRKNIEAIVSRGLLGAAIHDSLATVHNKKGRKLQSSEPGAEKSAYQLLLAKLPKTGAFKTALKKQRAVSAVEDDGTDERIISVFKHKRGAAADDDSEEDDTDASAADDDTGESESAYAGHKRKRNFSAGDSEVEDDENDTDGDNDVDEEDAEEDFDDSEADGSEGEPAIDDDDSTVNAETEELASRSDPFHQHYVRGTSDADKIKKLLAKARDSASACETELPAASIGAAWAGAETITFVSPEHESLDKLLKQFHDASEHSGQRLFPRAHRLVEESHVKAKVAAAWDATYGKEVHQMYVDNLKSLQRSAKRLRSDADDRSSETNALSSAVSAANAQPHPFTPLQHLLWNSLNAYRDVYFSAWTFSNAREIRTVSVLHALNHVMKARELVLKHDAKIKEAAIRARSDRISKAIDGGNSTTTAAAAASSSDGVDADYKDQGFTRPRVLILLPIKHSALRYVRTLLRLLPKHQVMNRNRFFLEFTEEGSGLGAEYEDDDRELKKAAKSGENASAAAKERLALLQRSLARREKEMLSDADDVEEIIHGVDSEDSRRHFYAYNKLRQGWSKNMLSAHKTAHTKGPVVAHESDSSSGDASSSDEDELSVQDGTQLPFSALGEIAGRKKFDDRIIPDAHTFQPDRRGKVRRKRSNKHKKKQSSKHRDAAQAIPKDYSLTFAGNVDDDFKLGISVGKKTVKLYADFYDADIIIASPLGIRRIVGGEGEKHRDYDFLSSIEVVMMDQANSCMLQNWDHVDTIFELTNKLPRKTDYTDFSRVREWNLGGLTRHFRQTIVYSSYMDVLANKVFRKQCENISGCDVIRCTYSGTISRVVPTVRQVFHRLDVSSLAEVDDARFSYFKDVILPELEAGISAEAGKLLGHTMIYVPSYFDYVRLRNLLDSREMEFVTCSEYMEDADVARSRSRFYAGQSPVMLLTERHHYFKRLRIRGIRHLLFYAPPNIHWFYDEFLNLLEEAAAAKEPVSATVLFTNYDALQLERIVGTQRSQHIREDTTKHSFTFV